MQLAAVTPERYGTMALKRNEQHYLFASQDSLIPVVAAELSQLVPMMPLAFLPTDGSYALVAVTSLLPGSNLFVSPIAGQWHGAYVPASLRAYPFRMAKPTAHDDPILCVIEGSGLIVPSGEGEPLFDEMGQPTKAIRDTVDFLSLVERSRLSTQVAVEALTAAGLIRPWPLVTKKDEAVLPVNGLFRIDESALNALDAHTLHEVRNKGALAIAYAQLFSMNQLSMLDKLKSIHEQTTKQAGMATAPSEAELNLEFLNKNGTISLSNLY